MSMNNKCKNCGGALNFDPVSNELKCTHCSSIENIEESSVLNLKRSITEADKVQRKKAEHTQFSCSVCGRKHITTADAELDRCPSCGSSQVEKTINIDYEPDGVIPFKLNEEKALESFAAWVKKRKFAPNNLKKMAKTKCLKGVYYPIYNFDVETTSHYSGVGVKTHSRANDLSRETRRHFKGAKSHSFLNYIESANTTIPSNNFREAGDFNYGEIYAYRTEFLYGFLAAEINLDLNQGCVNMRRSVCLDIEKDIKKSLHYDRIENFQCSTTFNQINYNHLYVPMWVSTYTYKDKTYSCYINGQTGKASGTAPKSFWKIFFTALGIGALIAAAAYLYMKSGL